MIDDLFFNTGLFACVTLISVKSNYGSCSGSCTGLINLKQSKIYKVKKNTFLFYLYINKLFLFIYKGEFRLLV